VHFLYQNTNTLISPRFRKVLFDSEDRVTMQTLAKNEKTNTLFSNLYIGRTVGNKEQRAQGIAGSEPDGGPLRSRIVMP
jgi:hypothetical protein